MKIVKYFLIILMMTLNLCLICKAEEKGKYLPKDESYFPITIGSNWKYNTNIGKMNVSVIEGEYHDSVICMSKNRYVELRENIYKTGTGVTCDKREMKILFFKDKYQYIPRLQRLVFPIETDKEWKWAGNKIRIKDRIETVYTELRAVVLCEEKVTIKAGSFDCIKVQLRISDNRGNIEYYYQWFAPGVGMVKSESTLAGSGVIGLLYKLIGGKIKMELESYQIITK